MMKTLSFRFYIELKCKVKRANKKLRSTKTSINFTCKYLRKNALCPGEEGERFDGEEGVRLWCLDLEEIAPPRLATFVLHTGCPKKSCKQYSEGFFASPCRSHYHRQDPLRSDVHGKIWSHGTTSNFCYD